MQYILSASVAFRVILPAIILFVIALVFAVLLAYLGQRLGVKMDARVEEVRSKLSGANCGACGYPGCDGFATALVEGKAQLSECSATASERKAEIANILGVSDTGEATRVVVRCRGGNEAKDKYSYMGYGDCRSMEILAGGRKQCEWGCLGMGSCVDECSYHAVDVNMKGYSEVIQDKCIACGKCIAACPKKLIGRIPVSAKVFVACSNHQKGKEVREICNKGCIACGICVRACEQGAISIQDNLAVIDYSKCNNCGTCMQKCPQHCILSALDRHK